MNTPCTGAVACVLFSCLTVNFVHGQDADVEPTDFSKTNAVTLLLAEADRGFEPTNAGLEHLFWEKDGLTTVRETEGVPCRCLSITNEAYPKGYLYFTIDPSFKSHELDRVRIDVEYFDGFALGVFGLQYDTTGLDGRRGETSRQLHPSVPLNGSGRWLKASFHVTDGTFRNSQNSGADFRLWASPPKLCVSRVTVTLEPAQESPSTKPLAFDKAGEATLREWNVQWDTGSQPSFARSAAGQEGPRWLEIKAPGTFAAGSWRTCPLLEAGEYQFVGRVQTSGVESGAEMSEGVCLRASGKPAAKRVSEAPDGRTLTYEFSMPASGYVELVCEFRGSQGSARFALDSLKLIRKSQSRE